MWRVGENILAREMIERARDEFTSSGPATYDVSHLSLSTWPYDRAARSWPCRRRGAARTARASVVAQENRIKGEGGGAHTHAAVRVGMSSPTHGDARAAQRARGAVQMGWVTFLVASGDLSALAFMLSSHSASDTLPEKSRSRLVSI